MSLINDALKKAQRDREAAQRAAAAEVAPGGAPADEGGKFKRVLVFGLLATVGVSAFSVWLTLRILREERPEAKPVAVAASPTPLVLFVKKDAATGGSSVSAAATPTPVTPTAAPTTVAALKVAAASTPVPTLAPTPSPVFSPEAEKARIQAMINRLRISGVRIAPTGNRALINDRLIRPGDLLDPESGLRILVIDEDHLEFTDAAGRPYQRRL